MNRASSLASGIVSLAIAVLAALPILGTIACEKKKARPSRSGSTTSAAASAAERERLRERSEAAERARRAEEERRRAESDRRRAEEEQRRKRDSEMSKLLRGHIEHLQRAWCSFEVTLVRNGKLWPLARNGFEIDASYLGQEFLSIAHPTGDFSSASFSSTSLDGNSLVLLLHISWNGGFTDKPYTTDVRIRIQKTSDNPSATLVSDTAIIDAARNSNSRMTSLLSGSARETRVALDRAYSDISVSSSVADFLKRSYSSGKSILKNPDRNAWLTFVKGVSPLSLSAVELAQLRIGN